MKTTIILLVESIFIALLFNSKIGFCQTVQTFMYTGTVQTFTVPICVSSITVKAWGAGGHKGGSDTYSGANGGGGAFVQSTISVTPGQILNIIVGGAGSVGGACAGSAPGGIGGWGNNQINGGRGGNAGSDGCSGGGGGGGAGTGIFIGNTPLIVAGGGGGGSGGGNQSAGAAGGGGGQNGFTVSGCNQGFSNNSVSGNGTQGGDRGNNVDGAGGGGGGGGLNGGSGGSAPTGCDCGGCGGGGGGNFAGGTGNTLVNGSGINPANGTDVDYIAGIGNGGTSSQVPGNGYIVLIYDQPSIAANFQADPVCFGQSNTSFVNNSSVNGGTIIGYSWDFGDGSALNTQQNPTYAHSSPGIYDVTLTVTSNTGCTNSITQLVIVNPSPIAQFIGYNSCASEPVVFTNQSITNGTSSIYDWSVNGVSQGASSNFTYSFPSPGTYLVNLTISENYGGSVCSSDYSQNITIYGNPVLNVFGDLSICEDEILLLTNNSTISPNENMTYVWSVNGQIASNTTNFQQVVPVSGNYTIQLTATSSSGCIVSDDYLLEVFPIPPAPTLSHDNVRCPGDLTTLNAQLSPNSTVFWSGPQGFSSSQPSNNFSVEIPMMGIYSAYQVSDQGCISGISQLELKIENIYSFDDFLFPNVISPNKDQINENLDVDSFFKTCDTYSLSFFNRWGNLVYKHGPGEIPFNGTASDGSELPDGIYYYKLEYSSGGSEVSGIKSGFFHVIR
jgi:gliding motility-associated-like protein